VGSIRNYTYLAGKHLGWAYLVVDFHKGLLDTSRPMRNGVILYEAYW